MYNKSVMITKNELNYYLICVKIGANMEITEIPEVGLFELHKEDVLKAGKVVNLDRNGFFYCRKGTLRLVFNERTFVMKKGDIFVYLQNNNIYVKEVSDDIEGVIGMAKFEFVLSAIQSVADSDKLLTLRDRPCISLSEGGQERLGELFSIIRSRSSEACNPIVYQILFGLARALCYQIMYEYFSGEPTEITVIDRQDVLFHKFIISLKKNYMQHRDVSWYAQESCLTPRYFSKIIKEKTGKSAMHWISVVVIDEARRLLDMPENSVKDVAFKLGFPNQSFFGRYFLKYYGMTPSEYRKNLGQ